MTEEVLALLYNQLDEDKQAFLEANPNFVPDGDFWDAHCCKMFADELGCCQWCGAVVHDSFLYKKLYGGE